MSAGHPNTGRLFLRALALRCPACGGHPIFSRWTRMAQHCPACGLSLNRQESGYSLGGFWLNLLFAELVTISLFVLTLLQTWPDPPWNLLQYGLPTLALLTPILFYPFSKTLFLALDLAVRPASREERKA